MGKARLAIVKLLQHNEEISSNIFNFLTIQSIFLVWAYELG